MLIEERIVALNDVVANAQRLVTVYRGEDERVPEQQHAVFARCAQDHESLIAQVEGCVRELGALPREEDPERLGLDKLFVDLRSLLAEDPMAAIVEALLTGEQELHTALQEALQHELPQAAAATLQAHQDTVAEHRQTLEALKAGA